MRHQPDNYFHLRVDNGFRRYLSTITSRNRLLLLTMYSHRADAASSRGATLNLAPQVWFEPKRHWGFKHGPKPRYPKLARFREPISRTRYRAPR